jgi:F-box-like
VDSPITATADERLYLNQLFQTAVQEVENLDKAILQGQIELLHLFQQKQASIDILKARRQTHIVRWKKFFALIYKLPDDVLLLIFELYVLEGGSPWTVAHVSKRFRDVAFKARKVIQTHLRPSFITDKYARYGVALFSNRPSAPSLDTTRVGKSAKLLVSFNVL